MTFGTLSTRQQEALAPFINDKVVHDFGAGDLGLARQLLVLGAKHVVAIDKNPMPKAPKGISTIRMPFVKMIDILYSATIDVAFVSWPANCPTDIEPFLEASNTNTVVYLGKNTDGVACGTPVLFKSMVRRELVTYVPERHNSLIVLGKGLELPRVPTGEEFAGMTMCMNSPVYSIEEAEEAALQSMVLTHR